MWIIYVTSSLLAKPTVFCEKALQVQEAMKKSARNTMETTTKKPTANIIQQLQLGSVRKYHYDAKLDKPNGALVRNSSKLREDEPTTEKEENENEGENHLLEFDSPTG